MQSSSANGAAAAAVANFREVGYFSDVQLLPITVQAKDSSSLIKKVSIVFAVLPKINTLVGIIHSRHVI